MFFCREISIVNNGCHILRAEDFRPLMFHKISKTLFVNKTPNLRPGKVPKLLKCNERFIIVVYEEIPEVIYICRREEPEQFQTLKFPKPILALELTFTVGQVRRTITEFHLDDYGGCW